MVEFETAVTAIVIMAVFSIIAVIGAYAKGRVDGEQSAVNKSKASLLSATLRKAS